MRFLTRPGKPPLFRNALRGSIKRCSRGIWDEAGSFGGRSAGEWPINPTIFGALDPGLLPHRHILTLVDSVPAAIAGVNSILHYEVVSSSATGEIVDGSPYSLVGKAMEN